MGGRALCGWILLGTVACASDGNPRHNPAELAHPSDTQSHIDTDADTGTVDTDTDTDTALTAELRIEPNPNRLAPWVYILTVDTNRATWLEVVITEPQQVRTLRFDTLTDHHEIDLLGLQPDRDNSIAVTVTDEGGDLLATEPEVVHPPNSAWVWNLTVEVADPRRMEPGYTLIRSLLYLYALDAMGKPVWRWGPDPDHEESAPILAHHLPNGNIRILLETGAGNHTNEIIEVNPRGNIVERWAAAGQVRPGVTPLDTPLFHHEVQTAPNDGLFVLSAIPVEVDDYPLSEDDPYAGTGPATIAADVVVELGLDGTARQTWPLEQLLDVTRIGYGSLQTDYWRPDLGEGVADWSHANAIHYDTTSDSLIVSTRHQDAVFSLDRGSGELNWILGPHENWGSAHQHLLLEPVGQTSWPYHQHAPALTNTGTLIMFDNGNFRASPPDQQTRPEDNASRLVEYRVDPVAMTVEEVWSWGMERGQYSLAQGDADPLPITGNVLAVWGNIVDPDDGVRARVVEVTRDDPPEVVFELAWGDDSQRYRAERIPSLYADGVETVTIK